MKAGITDSETPPEEEMSDSCLFEFSTHEMFDILKSIHKRASLEHLNISVNRRSQLFNHLLVSLILSDVLKLEIDFTLLG